MPMTRVVLADDHRIVREGLKALLEAESDMEVVGEAAEGRGIADLVAKLDPDVLLLDLMLPGLNGLEVTRQVSLRSPQAHIIVLSPTAKEDYAEEALRQGAVGVILKEECAETLVTAIHTVLNGGIYASPSLAERVKNIRIPNKPTTHMRYEH